MDAAVWIDNVLHGPDRGILEKDAEVEDRLEDYLILMTSMLHFMS